MTKRNLVRTEQERGRKPRIPKRIAQAIDLILTGRVRTQREAARQVGLSEEHLCRALKKDRVRAYLDQKTRETLSAAIPKAAATLLRLLDGSSEHVQRDVALELLALAGIAVPKDPAALVQINNSVGYVIDLSGSSAAPTIDGEASE